MFQKLKNKKVLIGLIVVSLLSLVYIYFSSKKTESTVVPPPPFAPVPTLPPLQIIDSYPNSGKFVLTFPVTALVFTFNQPIALNKIRVEILPKIDLLLSLNPTGDTLYARPKDPWPFNKEYKISVVGPGGLVLAENIITFLDPSKNPNPNDFGGDPVDPNYKP